MGFSECVPPPELLDDAELAPAPCGPCAAALPALKGTPIIAMATTRTSFFICPSDHSLRPNWRNPDGSRPSVGHAVLTVARAWKDGTPRIRHVVPSDRATESLAGSTRVEAPAASFRPERVTVAKLEESQPIPQRAALAAAESQQDHPPDSGEFCRGIGVR